MTPRPRRRSGEPSDSRREVARRRARARPRSAVLLAAACMRRSWPIRRRQRRPGPRLRPPRRRRRTRSADRAAARRRAARSADRMVVLHGPPPDRLGRRYGFEYVIFRAERGALPGRWASHLAITDEGGERVPLRPAERDRPAGRPLVDGTGLHPARLRLDRPVARSGPMASGPPSSAPSGRCAAATATTGCRSGHARRAARRVAGWTRPRPDAGGRRSRRRSTTATAGSTSARPAARTTTRGRAMTATGSVTLDGQTIAVERRRPGSITSGATSSRSAVAAGTGSR